MAVWPLHYITQTFKRPPPSKKTFNDATCVISTLGWTPDGIIVQYDRSKYIQRNLSIGFLIKVNNMHTRCDNAIFGEIFQVRSFQSLRQSSRGYTHTHTHPFNGPFSRTTQMSRYQKGKTNLDFTEARDSEWQWHQLEHMQVCTSLQTDNHSNTPPLSFLQAGCPSCRPTNSVKALKAYNNPITTALKLHKFFTCCYASVVLAMAL